MKNNIVALKRDCWRENKKKFEKKIGNEIVDKTLYKKFFEKKSLMRNIKRKVLI